MSQELRSILIGTSGLMVAAVVALALTVARGGVRSDGRSIRRCARVAVLAVACQAGHFTEELSTGFHDRFPRLFGLAPWPLTFFVLLNLSAFAIWLLCVWGLTRRLRVALIPLWFLGIASVVNGVAHPVAALATGGYFPGLFTSPLVGVVGIFLVRDLGSVTRTRTTTWSLPGAPSR